MPSDYGFESAEERHGNAVDIEKQEISVYEDDKGHDNSTSGAKFRAESSDDSEKDSRPGAKAGLTVTQFWTALAGLNLGMFLCALDFNIIATAVPVISSEFNEYANSSWIGTAFLVTFAITLPIYSRLGDIFGRQNMFTFGTVIFILGSGLCAGSKSMNMLIWSRAVQGGGAAGIYGLLQVIVTDLVPLRDVGKYLSFSTAIWVIADILGPLLGGAFSQYVTWRWCFWINLIISPISLLVTLLVLRQKDPPKDVINRIRKFDYIGTVVMAGGLVAVLLGISWGGNTFPWSDKKVIGCLVGGIAMVALFCVWECFAKEPLVDSSVLKNPTVVAICISEFFMGMNLLGMMYYVPQFFQLVYGDSATISGVGLLPMMIGTAIGAPAAGFITSKFGVSKWNGVVGGALMTMFSGLATRWYEGSSRAEVYVELVFLGVGQGASLSALLLSGQVAVKPALIGVVTGIIVLTLALGQSFGIALFSAVYVNELGSRLSQLSLLSPNQIQQVMGDVQSVHSLPPSLRDQVIQTWADSLKNGWWLMFACGAASMIAVLFAKQHKFT